MNMSPQTIHSLLLVLTAGAVTYLLRAIPFLLFGGKRQMPEKVRVVVDKLPPAIIAVLVIYCLKGDLVMPGMGTLISLAAVAGVIVVHLWKRNTLLSIAVGTVLYMIGIRLFL